MNDILTMTHSMFKDGSA